MTTHPSSPRPPSCPRALLSFRAGLLHPGSHPIEEKRDVRAGPGSATCHRLPSAGSVLVRRAGRARAGVAGSAAAAVRRAGGPDRLTVVATFSVAGVRGHRAVRGRPGARPGARRSRLAPGRRGSLSCWSRRSMGAARWRRWGTGWTSGCWRRWVGGCACSVARACVAPPGRKRRRAGSCLCGRSSVTPGCWRSLCTCAAAGARCLFQLRLFGERWRCTALEDCESDGEPRGATR